MRLDNRERAMLRRLRAKGTLEPVTHSDEWFYMMRLAGKGLVAIENGKATITKKGFDLIDERPVELTRRLIGETKWPFPLRRQSGPSGMHVPREYAWDPLFDDSQADAFCPLVRLTPVNMDGMLELHAVVCVDGGIRSILCSADIPVGAPDLERRILAYYQRLGRLMAEAEGLREDYARLGQRLRTLMAENTMDRAA